VIDLGNLGGVTSNVPFAINDLGQVAGISDVAGDVYQHAFLWTKKTGMQDLGTLPGDVQANALGLNNQTQVVGGSIDANNNLRAFLWQNGAMTDLNTLVQPNSGLHLIAAADINDAGEISGMALDNAGAVVGFVAVPNRQQPLSAGVGENNAGANIVLPERARELFRHRGPFGPRNILTVSQ
jgi:probable HAF family extracellular repeat protein